MNGDDPIYGKMDVDESCGAVNLVDIAEGVPREVCLRIFSFLDATHLMAASQVSKAVRSIIISLSDDQRPR